MALPRERERKKKKKNIARVVDRAKRLGVVTKAHISRYKRKLVRDDESVRMLLRRRFVRSFKRTRVHPKRNAT